MFSKKSVFRFQVLAIISILGCLETYSQGFNRVKWNKEGTSYYENKADEILEVSLPENKETTIVSKDKLIPAGQTSSLHIRNFYFSGNGQKLLIYTNTRKVWRYDTRGDYWVFDLANSSLEKLGKSLEPSSLMFAKFSPDGSKAAYTSDHNLYIEDLQSHRIKKLTRDGTRKIINGTFDWVYEEEFSCRDGFRWSPDGKKIAYWQIDASNTKDYLMIDNTDSTYPFIKPVEYPIAGEPPSPFKIGVLDIESGNTKWMHINTDTLLQSYLPRMEWAANNSELIVQHLNRKQNLSELLLCEISTGESKSIYNEKDSAWIDILPLWDEEYSMGGWDWLNAGRDFLWASEKDGWRHLFRINKETGKETLLTKGRYDVMEIVRADEKGNWLYFMASPKNATQKYLYRSRLDGKGNEERLSPTNQEGYHEYEVSPTAKYALHKFSNHYTPEVTEWISLPGHQELNGGHQLNDQLAKADKSKSKVDFFTIKSADGIEMDAWMVKPVNFDSTKKYPVVFYVYTEPWGQNVKDEYGIANNFLYRGDMASDGYIYISIDNRGTPVPKGREWRKCVYRKIGLINIRDQAMAAKEILKWPFVDSSRIAVWGWSGGGSATLNLMFQYPDIYKTGIAIAAVGNELTYDNIYQERYMGLPQENREDFIKGSPISYAKNLKGNLLYIHGSGDDNVHYSNADMLINELVKYNKQFQLMIYPNRTHSISEGQGTIFHLSALYTTYLKEHCPGGPR